MNENTNTLFDDNTGYGPKRTRRFCAFLVHLAVLYVLTFTAFFGYSQESTEQSEETTDANAPVTRAPVKFEPQQLDFIATDIASLMLEDQYQLIQITLDAGGENEQEHQFPVFVSPSQKALSMGTFYLVSDVAYNGAQIHSLMSLAEQMSVLGWNSVVVPAPQLMMVMAEVDAKKAAALTKAEAEIAAQNTLSDGMSNNDTPATKVPTDPNRPVKDTADSAAPDDSAEANDEIQTPNIQTMLAAQYHQSDYDVLYQQAFNEYLKSFLLATMSATERTGYQVFFAQGMSAQALISISPDNLAPDAIVINNLYWPQRNINQSLAMRMAQSTAPVLDLVSNQDNHWALATEQARNIQAKVEVKSHYRQRQIGMLGINTDISADMAKEIYGWLTYLGW